MNASPFTHTIACGQTLHWENSWATSQLKQASWFIEVLAHSHHLDQSSYRHHSANGGQRDRRSVDECSTTQQSKTEYIQYFRWEFKTRVHYSTPNLQVTWTSLPFYSPDTKRTGIRIRASVFGSLVSEPCYRTGLILAVFTRPSIDRQMSRRCHGFPKLVNASQVFCLPGNASFNRWLPGEEHLSKQRK